MPLTRRRFKSLNKTLKDNNGVAAPGSVAELYLNALIGRTRLTVPRKPGSAFLRKGPAVIQPFTEISAADEAAAATVAVPWTVQARNIQNDVASGLSLSLFGMQTTAPTLARPAGFYAAKAIIKATLSANVTTPPNGVASQWTGKVYKNYHARTGSVPYGKTAASDTEFDRRKAIAAALAQHVGATLTVLGVSFKPELYKPIQVSTPSFPTSPATGVPAN